MSLLILFSELSPLDIAAINLFITLDFTTGNVTAVEEVFSVLLEID